MMRRVALLVPALLASALVAGCGGDEAGRSTTSDDRAAVVAALVDEVIVPANDRAASTAAAFASAVDALCASPAPDTLAAAREALAAGWAAWKFTDSFDIGPAMKRRSTSVMSYQVDTAKVDATLAASPPTDAATVRNRTGSSLRGYGAAAHLLAGDPASPGDPAAFTQPARCGYLAAVAAVLADESSVVAAAWSDGIDAAPPYRETALGKGAGALSTTDVVDRLVNMQVSQLEAATKLLTAVVEADAATPALPTFELFQLAAQVEGTTAVYGQLGRLLDAKLEARVRRGLAAIADLLSGSAAAPSESQPDAALVTKLGQAVDDAHLTIGTDVVSALDVTITFSDNDGDS